MDSARSVQLDRVALVDAAASEKARVEQLRSIGIQLADEGVGESSELRLQCTGRHREAHALRSPGQPRSTLGINYDGSSFIVDFPAEVCREDETCAIGSEPRHEGIGPSLQLALQSSLGGERDRGCAAGQQNFAAGGNGDPQGNVFTFTTKVGRVDRCQIVGVQFGDKRSTRLPETRWHATGDEDVSLRVHRDSRLVARDLAGELRFEVQTKLKEERPIDVVARHLERELRACEVEISLDVSNISILFLIRATLEAARFRAGIADCDLRKSRV